MRKDLIKNKFWYNYGTFPGIKNIVNVGKPFKKIPRELFQYITQKIPNIKLKSNNGFIISLRKLEFPLVNVVVLPITWEEDLLKVKLLPLRELLPYSLMILLLKVELKLFFLHLINFSKILWCKFIRKKMKKKIN